MRSPFVVLLALIFALVLVGLAALNSSILVLTIPLFAYLLAAVWDRPEALRLKVTREVFPDYAPQDTPINIRLTLINEGAALDELVVRDVLPRGVTKSEGTTARVVTLPEGGSVEIEYTIEAQRGEYDRYEVQVYARDFLHFFEQAQSIRTSARLVIHPRYPKLDRIRIRPPQTRGFAGPIAARQGGVGIDFWGVREYQAGDPQRQINWKLSARSESELFTTVFEQERVADVGLIVDARERTNVSTGTDSLFEHSAKAAAALAENFLDDGNRVSLLIYGSGISRVFPGYGRLQHDRILKALARATPGFNYALDSLTNLPTRLFPAKSQIVLISALMPEDTPVIARMRANGYAVLVISPDPVAYEAALAGDPSGAATRLAQAERTLMLRQLRQSGAQVVDWRVDQPLESIIRQAMAQQLRVGW
ncbi:MAG TPA: DUF58 domain-containing protein [Phototrophicaceae bacterium]|nr:DUF58 domain-containing protein [Phototrophicaceae bacterium]